MHRFRSWKALIVIWVRIACLLAAVALCFNSSAGYVMGLAERPDPNAADLITTLSVLASPSFYWLIGGTVLIGPAILVALLHYGWTWLLRKIWSHWPTPRLLNSLWEGYLSVMVFWAGLVISFLIFIPLAAQSPNQESAEKLLDTVSGIAVLLILIIWHVLFWLEIQVRQQSTGLAPSTNQLINDPVRGDTVPEIPDPIEQDLRRLKTTIIARDRQQDIAAANQQPRPTRSRKSQAPFDDPNF